MVKAGLMRRAKDGVRLLGGGEIKSKVAFSVWGASKSAVAAVEKAGGTVTILAPKREEPKEPKGKNKRIALGLLKPKIEQAEAPKGESKKVKGDKAKGEKTEGGKSPKSAGKEAE
jgi:large subunit ribosomal protein L15